MLIVVAAIGAIYTSASYMGWLPKEYDFLNLNPGTGAPIVLTDTAAPSGEEDGAAEGNNTKTIVIAALGGVFALGLGALVYFRKPVEDALGEFEHGKYPLNPMHDVGEVRTAFAAQFAVPAGSVSGEESDKDDEL